ncbi:MAG: hypothetical protein AAGC55_13960, partial [Myxococcota bacterium]
MIILFNQAPAEGCTVAAALNADAQGAGLIDTSATFGYFFTPLIQNVAQSISTDADDVAARRAILNGANIR